MAEKFYSHEITVYQKSLGNKLSGSVNWYNPQKGFGYITEKKLVLRHGTCVTVDGSDYFFHISEVSGPKLPETGDCVEFKLRPSNSGHPRPEAMDVQIMEPRKQMVRVTNYPRPQSYSRPVPRRPQVGRGEHYRKCNNCHARVQNSHIKDGVAYFRCSCGARFTGKIFSEPVPERTSGAAMAIGATIGGGLGGVPGMIIGGLIGGLCGTGEVTSNCSKCGTIVRPKGQKRGLIQFQCPKCLKTWVSHG